MRMNWNAFLIFITLISATVVTVLQALPPSPLPGNTPAVEFSAERAIEHIRIIAKTPRPTGSAALDEARSYVLAVLTNLGMETATQRTDTFENVMGRIKGTSSSEAVLLTAHLDSKDGSPGASDDGSGVVILLETARVLRADAPLRNTVIFLFTDSEESGMHGAKAFIASHPSVQDVKVVIGFDAGWLGGPGILSTTSTDNGWLIRQLVQADRYITGSSAINALASSQTDFGRGFKVAGFSGYAFDLYWDVRIHTPEDNIENLNPSSIQHQGYHAVSLARHFGNLDQLDDPKESDAIYFSVLRLFVVCYSSAWAVPLAIAVAGIFGGVLVFGLRRKILTGRGIGYGAFVLLAGLIIAPLPNILLGDWIHNVAFQVTDHSLNQPLEVGLIIATTLILTLLWYALSRRIGRASLLDLSIGALVPMVFGMIGTSIALPEISFAFTWPLLFSLLASASWFHWYARRKGLIILIAGLLISGVANVVILAQSILLGLFDQTTLTLVFLGVLCGFLVPHIHIMLGCTIENQKQMQETRTAQHRLAKKDLL